MNGEFHFTYPNLKRQLQSAQQEGYRFFRCIDYYRQKNSNNAGGKTVVFRIDVDFSCKKLAPILEILDRLNIRATIFIRLHAPEYNPFDFENYRIIKQAVSVGHEIGYHSEVIDQSTLWDEAAEECLRRDIDIINRMFNIKIWGVASHGGMTGLNNLDFWEKNKAKDYGILYEAYDREASFNLFQEAFYISDSEWHRWKCYSAGKQIMGDYRSFEEHLRENHDLIYLLIHSDTFFARHFYE